MIYKKYIQYAKYNIPKKYTNIQSMIYKKYIQYAKYDIPKKWAFKLLAIIVVDYNYYCGQLKGTFFCISYLLMVDWCLREYFRSQNQVVIK